MAKFCGLCGTALSEGINVCPKCGNIIKQPGSEPENTNQESVKPEGGFLSIDAVSIEEAPEQQNQFPIEPPAEIIPEEEPEPKKKRRVPIAAVIAIILCVLFLACGGYLYYFFYVSQESRFEQKLAALTDKKVIEFCYDDFNKDGIKEAFAVAATGEKDSFSDGEIWFVSNKEGKKLKEKINGKYNGILEGSGKKYICVEVENKEEETSLSYVYGVKKADEPYEPEFSGKFQNLHQDGKNVIGTNPADGKEVGMVLLEDGDFGKIVEEEETTEPETTAFAEQTTVRTTNPPANRVSRTVYKDILNKIMNNPRAYYNAGSESIANNTFAFGDVDNDGAEELVVRFSAANMASAKTSVWDYNETDKTVNLKYETALLSDFYRNGYIKEQLSHNQTTSPDFWPYVIKKAEQNGTLTEVCSVLAYEKEYSTGITPFPEEEDRDKDGIVYSYTIGTATTYMTKAEYDMFEGKYLPKDQKVNLRNQNLTIENINGIK